MEIRGGAGPYEVAAIVAAVTRVLAEEEAAAATPPRRQDQGRWVLTGRTRPVRPPLAVDLRPVDPWGNLTPQNGEPG
jgi:hypothetical protein